MLTLNHPWGPIPKSIHPSFSFEYSEQLLLSILEEERFYNGFRNMRYSMKVVVASSSNPSTSNNHYFIHPQESEGADFGKGL
ncbi:hypothetical protein N9X97_01250 [Schleiferiaceae bacterium]|nr:hypothetical protein [Schleiferiaceae bacterium]